MGTNIKFQYFQNQHNSTLFCVQNEFTSMKTHQHLQVLS